MAGIVSQLRRTIGDRALVIIAASVPVIFLVVSIAISPWANDDTLNKDFHAGTLEAGKTLWSQIGFYTDFWATSAGRFFPGSVTWTFGLFWFVQNRVAYKLIIALILVSAVLMLSVVTWVYTKNIKVAALLFYILLSILQIRVFLDGLTSFTGLLPLTTLLTITALLLSSGYKGWILPTIGALLFQIALFTYETVILFVPILMLLVWVRTKKWIRTLVFAVPAILTAYIALSLRSQLDPASTPVAYSVSLNPSAVISTFLKQISAALPLSQWVFNAPGLPQFSKTFVVLALLLVGIPVFFGLMILTEKRVDNIPTIQIGMLAFVGLWVMVTSASIISITARWQQDLAWGEGYLNVVYEYFGLSLISTAVVLLLLRWCGSTTNKKLAWSIRWIICVVIALLAAMTVASNLVLTS